MQVTNGHKFIARRVSPVFDGAPCERRHEMQFQSFVERYVATLFAQCRQIATVFETGDGPKVANEIPRAGIALPILDFESISLDEKDGNWGTMELLIHTSKKTLFS